MEKRSWSIDSLVLIFSIIVLAQLLGYAIPQGEFDRAPSESNPNRMEVVPGTYGPVDEEVALKPWVPLTILFEGFDHGKNVIFFIFIVGGMFAVLRATGAIDALLGVLIRNFGNQPLWLIGGCMFVFAMGSSTSWTSWVGLGP